MLNRDVIEKLRNSYSSLRSKEKFDCECSVKFKDDTGFLW